MIEIEQEILKKKNLYSFITKLINTVYSKKKIDYSIFFPKEKEWFIHYKKILKNMLKDSKNIKSLVYYKGSGYININKLLISKSLPYVYLFSKYDNSIKNIYNKTLINTDPIYIFPDDLKKISDHKKNNLLKHISNIDYLFTKYYNELILSDCILFRGMSNEELLSNKQKSKVNFNDLFYKMRTQKSVSNTNKLELDENNEFLFDNYISTTFNIKTGLNFASNILLVLNIKKEHNIPGIYLSNLFFSNINSQKNLNNFFKTHDYEFEILLHRNFKIKIKKVKTIKIDRGYYFSSSINELYKKDKKDKKENNTETIKIVFAESCPFEIPPEFQIENDYKYICKSLQNN
jgi:hypothetical protein